MKNYNNINYKLSNQNNKKKNQNKFKAIKRKRNKKIIRIIKIIFYK